MMSNEFQFNRSLHLQQLDEAVAALLRADLPDLANAVSLARKMHNDHRCRAHAAARAQRAFRALEQSLDSTGHEAQKKRITKRDIIRSHLELAAQPEGPNGLLLYPEIKSQRQQDEEKA